MASAYRIFSKNTWKNWEKSGKAEVVTQIRSSIQGNEEISDSADSVEDISAILYEVVFAVVRGHLRKDFAKPLLSEMLSWSSDLGSQLVEVISLVELEISTVDRLAKQRDQLFSLIKLLDLDKLYKERLDIDTLGDAGIIKNKKNFLTKQIKVRTKMFYKQQKFNLLREESEGYAKLVTELNQEITSRITPTAIIQVIRSLIGCFNLDPNRVLDLILEAFEKRPQEHKFYNGLLHLFPHEPSTVSEIIGFKLISYSDKDNEMKSILILLALLLHSNILSIDDIYGWLTPEDSTMDDDHRREMEAVKEFVFKANVVSTKDKDQEKDKKEKEKEEEERTKAEQKNLTKYNTNLKMQLAIALLQVGNWTHFMDICNRFPEYYLVSCSPISEAMCQLIHFYIDPLYKRNTNLPSRVKSQPLRQMKICVAQPSINTYEQFAHEVFPKLLVLGPYIYHDVCLLYKILRIARNALKSMTKDSNGLFGSFYYDFLSVLDECILPAVSMFESNPCIAEEVWDTIKIYPYQYRYKLYGRWKNETYKQHPTMVKNRIVLLKKAKYIMMRITKETIKPVSRGIGKHTHNFPGPIFEYILMQVQIYDNLIGPVVDSFKYLTSLSYDVLGYCIVEVLSLCKDRTQNKAMAISQWLQSLSGFCGSVCKKYSLDLGGILQFVANQLKSETSIDLLLLKDIVQKMGGTDSMGDLTTDQLEAMCGGEHLRREAGQYLQEKNTKRSSIRLKESLMENNLAVPLLLLMGQQRSSIVYNQTESPHLKLVGKLYDQCQDTMVQFGSYLFQMVTIEELSREMPPIDSLLAQYHISADVAFFLARPMFNHLFHNKYDELRRKDKSEKKLTVEDKKRIFAEACNAVLVPLGEAVRPHYSSKIWEDMNVSFFLTFWALTMSDLEVPVRIYDKEIKKLAEMPTNKSRKRDIDRFQALKEKLEDEKRRQIDHTERVHEWLMKEAPNWFNLRTARSPKNDTVTTFLQLCIFPRCTFSTLDAIYCANFVKLLHSLRTPNFSTLLCYDKMYCDITYTVTSCTEQEAHHYARFLLGTLDTVMHWHECQENFKEECARYPGFITRYRISTHEANDYVDYENYRHVVHKWHYKITKALVMCLESEDYIQIRNAILILQGILPRFPAIANLSPVIEKRVERVMRNEKDRRNDLFVLANSYSGRLKAKKPHLILENKFHIVRKLEDILLKATKVITPTAPPSEDDTKRVKEQTAEVNGDIDIKDEGHKKAKLEKIDQKPEPKCQTEDKEDCEKDEKRKREKKKEEKDKESKIRKEKRIKEEEEEEEEESSMDDLDDQEQRESSVASNVSSASGKMEPPSGERHESTRSSKRRKTDHESKSRKEEVKKGKKRMTRSHSGESTDHSPSASPKHSKKERRDRKRASSPPQDVHKAKSRKSQKTQSS